MSVRDFVSSHRQLHVSHQSDPGPAQFSKHVDQKKVRGSTVPSTTKPPVIFIHGLWIHSAAWQPWTDLFTSHGYATSAPGWPGDGPTVAATRENPDGLNDKGIAEMVAHYAEVIGTPEVKPVAVGHSFGGLI